MRPEAAASRQSNAGQANVSCVFYEGDSRDTLTGLETPVQFAWIDGGHDTPSVRSDLQHCRRLRVPFVALDDTAYPTVRAALDDFLRQTAYTLVPNPYGDQDRRQAVLLRLSPS